MKKIVSAVAAGALLAGAAFAEFTVTGNARVYSDLFTYASPSRNTQADDTNGKGTDDNGKVIWAKDTKHADDITIAAKGENVGAKIVFSVTGNYASTDPSASTSGSVGLTSYQLWMNFGKIRVDAGAYDQRIGSNINMDGNWGSNYPSLSNKPGHIVAWGDGLTGISSGAASGKTWGKDSLNITNVGGGTKKTNNFQATVPVNDNLTLHGVLFLSTYGTGANFTTDNTDTSSNTDLKDHSEKWIFTPFALGAEYKLDKDNKIAFSAKLASIKHGSYTAAKTSYSIVTNTNAKASSDDQYSKITMTSGAEVKADEDTYEAGNKVSKGGYTDYDGVYIKKTETSASYTPDNSVWVLAAEYATKLGGFNAQFDYTLGMSLYSNWSGYGAHYSNRLVRDYDQFVHGFDARAQGNLNDQLKLTVEGNVTYVQGTAAQKASLHGTSKGTTYKDRRAMSYDKGAAGQLAYQLAVGVDFAASDTVTYQFQTGIYDKNLFGVEKGDNAKTGHNGKSHVDYLSGLTWGLRPAILVSANKTSQFFAGLNVELSGFQTSASGVKNTFKTTTTIPVGMRVKL